jgi:hypothetical protein
MRRIFQRPARAAFVVFATSVAMVAAVAAPLGGLVAHATNTDGASPTTIEQPLVVTLGMYGYSALWSQPVDAPLASSYTAHVCHLENDCIDIVSSNVIKYVANSYAVNASVNLSFWLYGHNEYIERNTNNLVTVTISAGSPADPATTSIASEPFPLLPPDGAAIDASNQFLQPTITQNTLTYMSFGMCFNRTSDQFRWHDLRQYPDSGLLFRGYSLQYALSTGGQVVQSGPLSFQGTGSHDNVANGRYCEDGGDGQVANFFVKTPYALNRAHGIVEPNSLEPATAYTLTFSLVSDGQPTVSGSVDFTTPDGCGDLTAQMMNPAQVPSYWMRLLHPDGSFAALFQGFSPRQMASSPTSRYQYTYVTPLNTGIDPFNLQCPSASGPISLAASVAAAGNALSVVAKAVAPTTKGVSALAVKKARAKRANVRAKLAQHRAATKRYRPLQ